MSDNTQTNTFYRKYLYINDYISSDDDEKDLTSSRRKRNRDFDYDEKNNDQVVYITIPEKGEIITDKNIISILNNISDEMYVGFVVLTSCDLLFWKLSESLYIYISKCIS